MIRYRDSILCAAPDVYMDIKACQFWEALNPRIKNGDLSQRSLCRRLDKLLVEYENGDHFTTISASNRVKEKRHIDYLKYLKINNYSNLESIVKSSPEMLTQHISQAFQILHITDITERSGNTFKAQGFGKLLLDRIFTYKAFRSSQACVKFYKSLGLEKKHCFYCNDSEIGIISKIAPSDNKIKDAQGRMLFDLDHFYLKSRFPFLSLSFYNLIPCCGLCNSTFRGAKDFNIKTHINPFIDSFDENYYFSFENYELAMSFQEIEPKIKNIKLKRKLNAPKQLDRTGVDLEIENRNIANAYDVNNLLGDIINYSDQGWECIANHIHGYNDHRIPRDRNRIFDASKAKLYMDFIEKIKNLF